MSTLKNSNGSTKPSQPLSEGTVRKQGCPHNILREMIGVQTHKVWRQKEARMVPTFVSGDVITLRCPRGCSDIYVTVK